MIIKNWEYISLHTWLIMSSYGIMFACFSFLDDLGCLFDLTRNYRWIKRFLSIFFGFLFYLIIGLPHLNGAKNR
jgi:hypothetical protein